MDDSLLSKTAAQVKRFLECLQGDSQFRALLAPLDKKRANAFLQSRGVDLDIEELSPFFSNGVMAVPDKTANPVIQEWKNTYHRERGSVDHVVTDMEKSLSPVLFKNWRARQIGWLRDNQGQEKPFSVAISYELSVGCSMGCPFCAFSAKKLSEIFSYSKTNAKLWRQVLDKSTSILGGGAQLSCCYHTTEPFDNPDYLKFIQDVYDITGVVPQTTTAAPLRDVGLTRRMLEKRVLFPVMYDRFSIHSPQMLARVHETFSVMELARVPLVIIGGESLSCTANAGRARKHSPERYDTIECTCGFVVNMCQGSIKLVMPCPADDKYPQGFAVLGEGRFSSADEFESVLKALCRDHIPAQLPEILNFRHGLEYRQLENGFELNGCTRKYGLGGKSIYTDAGRILAEGSLPSKQFIVQMTQMGHSPVNCLAVLSTLFSNGLFSELP